MAYSIKDMEASLAALEKSTKDCLQNIDIKTICARDDKEDPLFKPIYKKLFLDEIFSKKKYKNNYKIHRMGCGATWVSLQIYINVFIIKNYGKKNYIQSY